MSVNPYLTFSSPNSFTLNVVDNIKYWDGTIEYSTDTTTWNTWSGTSAISSSQSGATKYLYLRGTGNTYITGSNGSPTTAHWVLTGSNISCDGNIENLLDYQTVALGSHPTMVDRCYQGMFYGSTSLIKAPELLATTLASNCYREMFKGCTNIKLSTTQTDNYTKPYRIPTSEAGVAESGALTGMFTDTGGTFRGTPAINTTYYLWVEPQLSVDLTTLSGWSDVSAGSHTLKVKAKATGYRDSALSAGVQFTKAEQYIYEQTGTVLKITSAPYEQSGGTLIL